MRTKSEIIDDQKDRISKLRAEVLHWKKEAKRITDEYAIYRTNVEVILDRLDKKIIEGGKSERENTHRTSINR